jgi:hypothetical protein
VNKNQFAHKNGFSSYLELQMSSKVLFKDTNTWLVTRTEYGFLAWVDKFLDKPLGYFDSFDLAKQEIIDIRNQASI